MLLKLCINKRMLIFFRGREAAYAVMVCHCLLWLIDLCTWRLLDSACCHPLPLTLILPALLNGTCEPAVKHINAVFFYIFIASKVAHIASELLQSFFLVFRTVASSMVLSLTLWPSMMYMQAPTCMNGPNSNDQGSSAPNRFTWLLLKR